ncbi:MAG: HAD family hydrolase [Promethearchaeota archaeon]
MQKSANIVLLLSKIVKHPILTNQILDHSMKTRGFIFDLDGTLIDSLPLHLRAWKETLKIFGFDRSEQDILTQFGKTNEILTTALTNISDINRLNELITYKKNYVFSHFDEVKLFPGVEDFLKQLQSAQIPFTFATNGTKTASKFIIQHFPLLQKVKAVITTSEVTHGKPDPEMVLKAIEVMNLTRESVLMVGDSIFDLKAGKAAGVRTIGICGHHNKAELEKEKPWLILENFNDILKYVDKL